MSLEFTISAKPEYIYVQAEGPATFEGYQDLLQNVAAACREHNCNRILLDATITGRLTTIEIYNLSSKLRHLGFTHTMRAAYIEKQYPDVEEDYHFAETVANNLGFNVYITDNREDALKWLLKK